MPGCIYKIRDRVMVPTVDGVQGIVISCLESIDSESVYGVRWFDRNAQPISESFKESEIVAAQPVAAAPLPDVIFKVSGIDPAPDLGFVTPGNRGVFGGGGGGGFDTRTTATMSGARQSAAKPDKPRRKRRSARRSKRR